MNKENCALKLVDEIILYYDARSKKHQISEFMFCAIQRRLLTSPWIPGMQFAPTSPFLLPHVKCYFVLSGFGVLLLFILFRRHINIKVTCMFLSDFNQIWEFRRQTLLTWPKQKLHENPNIGCRVVPRKMREVLKDTTNQQSLFATTWRRAKRYTY